MAVLTEKLPHAGGFLITEGNGDISRESVTILSGRILRAGTVLGRIRTAAATAAAVAGNTGTGTIGAVTVGAGAMPGVYRVACIEPATNAGKFQVEDPRGVTVGVATVAVEFTGGGLTFTIADASTDFAAGDSFTITVAEGSRKCVALDPDGADGRHRAYGVLYRDVDATAADAEGAAIVRHATVTAAHLVWPDGITDEETAAALADLAASTVIAR